MNNYKRLIIRVFSTILAITTFVVTGCSGNSIFTTRKNASKEESPSQAITMVLGVHKYFPQISYNVESIYSEIYNSCYSWGNVSAIVTESNPEMACNYDIKKPDKNIDEAKRNQIAKNNTSQIISELSTVRAKNPEIDTLASITVGAQDLNSKQSESKKMLIMDSGLTTAGLLNFADENIIDVPTDIIVEQLKKSHAIPEMSGIHVTWVGLGETCGEQDSLSDNFKYKLQNIWDAILSAGGANITWDSTPFSGEEYKADLPECKTVSIVQDTLNLDDVIAEEEIPEIIKCDENTTIKFKSDSSEFVDEAAAAEALVPIANYLIGNQDSQIYIAGMTATVGDVNSSKELSLMRAVACKNILERKGVNKKQLTCIGLGQTSNSLRVNDIDSNSNLLIEELAQLNRAVFFIQKNSAVGNELLQWL